MTINCPDLREYQRDAVAALLDGEWRGSRRLAELPTGSGKALVAAETLSRIADTGSRALCLTHVRELVEQDASAFESLGSGHRYGINCAGLGRRDVAQPVIFASVASVAKRMPELLEHGDFAAVMIDEAHRIPGASASSMYSQCLAACPDAAVFGLTATPFRLDGGHLVGMRTHDGSEMFDTMAYRIDHRTLVDAGYLSTYIGLLGASEIDTTGVRKQGGDFAAGDLQDAAIDEKTMAGAVSELMRYAADLKSILIFASGVDHARALAEIVAQFEPRVVVVVGDTAPADRDEAVAKFRSGAIRVLINCQVFTTGFDAPNVDCIAMMRPTCSLSLAVQMLGRGARKSPGKARCTILDFAGNIERLNLADYFDGVEPTFELVEAREQKAAREAKERAEKSAWRPKHLATAWDGATGRQTWHPLKITAMVIEAKNPKYSGRAGVMVTYTCREGRSTLFLGVEYPGYSQIAAARWFSRRQVEMPRQAVRAAARVWGLPLPVEVDVTQRESGGRTYTNVVAERFAVADAFAGETVE